MGFGGFFMENKKQNEEIQSRRDFFKKTANNQKVMKTLLPRFVIIMIACLFTSCLSTTKISYVPLEADYREAFIGKHHNFIVSSFGAPDRQTSDGAGGTILIYEKTTTTSNSNSMATAYNVNYFSKTYTPGTQTSTVTTQNTSYIHLFMDKDGVCYKVKSNHEKLVTDFDEEAVKINERNRKMWKWLGIITGGPILVELVVLAIIGQ